MTPFIRNHQYNLISKQLELLQHARSTVSDPKVVQSVQYSVEAKIIEAFEHLTDEQQHMLGGMSALQKAEHFQAYAHALEPYLIPFPQVTEKQIKKLFHKNKKLTVPDLNAIDYARTTYMGWQDIATGKMFLVYQLNGDVVGIEGKFTPTNKKSTCFICHKQREAALFTAVSKAKPANASPDYYKAVGNYMCLHSEECNRSITDISALERFVRAVTG